MINRALELETRASPSKAAKRAAPRSWEEMGTERVGVRRAEAAVEYRSNK